MRRWRWQRRREHGERGRGRNGGGRGAGRISGTDGARNGSVRVASEVLKQLLRGGEAFATVNGVTGHPVADIRKLRGRGQRAQLRVGVSGSGYAGRGSR